MHGTGEKVLTLLLLPAVIAAAKAVENETFEDGIPRLASSLLEHCPLTHARPVMLTSASLPCVSTFVTEIEPEPVFPEPAEAAAVRQDRWFDGRT